MTISFHSVNYIRKLRTEFRIAVNVGRTVDASIDALCVPNSAFRSMECPCYVRSSAAYVIRAANARFELSLRREISRLNLSRETQENLRPTDSTYRFRLLSLYTVLQHCVSPLSLTVSVRKFAASPYHRSLSFADSLIAYSGFMTYHNG